MYAFPFPPSFSWQYIYYKKKSTAFCLFACSQALTVSIKQILEHHAANTNTMLLMHFAVHKCSPCTTAGSVNFQLCNLTHPSCQRPTESGLEFYRFHNQSVSFMDRDQGELEATASSCSQKKPKTRKEEDQEQEATRRCEKMAAAKRLAWMLQ